MIEVALLAASPEHRAELRARLTAADVRVVAEGGRADDLVEADVIVVASGADLASIDADEDTPALVVLDDDERTAKRVAAMASRGWGLISPAASSSELAGAVRAVAEGLVVVPPDLAARRWAPRAGSRGDSEGPSLQESLTPRELDILQALALGRANREIAAVLGISEHTVKYHLASIYGKLEASTRTEAVNHALRRGLITL